MAELTEEDLKNMSPEEIAELQKQNCIFCKIIKGEIPSKVVYDDDRVFCILDINPAAEGHMLVMPKEHYQIMPQIPDDVIGHMGLVVKMLSQSALRGLDAKGTTTFMANGAIAGQKAPHFMIHIIPRKEKDNVGMILPKFSLSDNDRKKLLEVLQPAINDLFGIKELPEKPKEEEKEEEPLEKPEEPEEEKVEKKKEKPKKKPKKKTAKKKATPKKPEKPDLDKIAGHKMTCKTCDRMRKEAIYKDEEIAILLAEEPATAGHLKIIPAKHFLIMEEIPSNILSKLFITSNKISTLLFEKLNAHGSNIIIQNGTAAGQTDNHFVIDIIPRRENDNLNLEWKPGKASEDDLSTVMLKLQENTKYIDETKEEKPVIKQEESAEIKEKKGVTNYMLKSLDRIP
jgi:histidine triad (HIT) family protein